MKRILFAALLCAVGEVAFAVDTDGDGLLDLVDVPGFTPSASGVVRHVGRQIEDLDGAGLLTRADGLDVRMNKIASLESGDFQGLDRFQLLRLADNQISSLESDDFQGLDNLQFLYLDGNPITSLASGGFQTLGKLRRLSLRDNQITSLENGDFQGLGNLHTLDMWGNQLASIEAGDFQGLDNLQTLDLGSNAFTNLSDVDFQGLNNLRSLDVSHAQIASLENGSFEGLGNLRLLYLQGNPITTIESGAFEGLDNLQLVSLLGNSITSIGNGAFRGLDNLETLNLTGGALTELNLTDARLSSLSGCEGSSGFCVDSSEITDLILDRAVLSQGSLEAIVRQTRTISNVSLVGLDFSDSGPDDLSTLLSIGTLQNVRVDQALFDQYAAELLAFDAMDGHTVTLVSFLRGDYNSSGAVEEADLDLVLLNWGSELVDPDAAGWINDLPSGPIDQEELDKVLLNWGDTAAALGSAGVPEPSTAVLLIGLVATCWTGLECFRNFHRCPRRGLSRWST